MLFSSSPRLWQVRCFAVLLLASLGTALFGQVNQPSAVDGFDPNANGVINAAIAQRDGKVILAGAFTTLRPNGSIDNVDRGYVARVNADGTLDYSFNPTANAQVFAMAVQSTGKILIGGSFTSVSGVTHNRIARLNADGSLDTSFNVDLGGGLAPEVYSLLVLPDDRIVVGGAFTTVGGVTRNRIARLSSNGVLDTTYDPNANGSVLSLAREGDGKIILGGSFTALQPASASAPTVRRYLARLNTDGTPDSQFDPKPDNTVRSIAVQTDGAILVGGNFASVQPLGTDTVTTRTRLARLNPDGTLDAFYSPNANGQVSAIVLQSDGRALLVGNFTTFLPNGTVSPVGRTSVARLNVDGTVDTSFQVQCNGTAQALALQSDGRVVIGGEFTQLRVSSASVAVNRNRVARLNADGSPDITLDPAASGLVLVQAMQSNGQIVVGGSFTVMGGLTRNYLARLNADGTVDTAFNPQINAPVLAIAIDANQNILIGGVFTNIGGTTRTYLARLDPTGKLDTTFNPSPNNQVVALGVQSDSKIIIAGSFTAVSPEGGALLVRGHIARLTNAGQLDTAFDPNADASPSVVTIQSDQKILLGGTFSTFSPNGTAAVSRPFAARLNTDGTVDTSYYPLPNGAVESQVIQDDGKIILGGNFTAFAPKQGTVVIRYYIARFNTDSTIDTSFNPRAGSTVAALAVQSGKILAGGLFSFFRPGDDVNNSIDRNRLARINADGTIDTTFDPNVGGQVSTVLALSTGKILVGGGFTSMKPASQGLVLTPNRFSRLNSDGTVDTTFDPANTTKNGGSVEVLAVQPDSRLVVAGGFNNFGGSRSSNLARFTASGDPDPNFIPNPDGPVAAVLVQPNRVSVPQANLFAWFNANSTLRSTFNQQTAVSLLVGSVYAIFVQPEDGKIILGGNFTNKASTTGNYLVRLNKDGSFDTSWDPQPSGIVNAIARQADGKLVIGGSFDSIKGTTRYRIARLNTDGSVDTGFDPYAGDAVSALAIQSDGKIIVGGAFTTFQPNGATATTARSYLARLNTDGTLDTAYNPLPGALVRAVTLQPDGKLLVGGDFASFQPNSSTTTTSRNFIARLNTDGTLDTDFNPVASAAVYAIALQPSDNKPIIGGAFVLLQPTNGGAFTRHYVARLNTDGTVDSNFDPSPSDVVRAIAVTADGSVLLGGSFTGLQPGSSFNPVARNHLALVGSDGALNTAFNPGPAGDVLALTALSDGSVLVGGAFTSLAADANLIVGGNFANIGGSPLTNLAQLDSDGSAAPTFAPNPNGAVLALAQQPDTKLIVGGAFTSIAGLPRNYLARISTDGVLDTAFNPNVAAGGSVTALALQSTDGKIVLGGTFTAVGGVAHANLARINADGSLDAGFTAVTNGQVSAVLLRPNGQIVVAGSFSTVSGQTRNRIARLNADGSLDAGFNPNVSGTAVVSLAASVDGKLIIGGTFTSVTGAGRNNIARLNADGTLDTTFDPNADGSVLALALPTDGAPIVGGIFSTITGQPRFRLARLAASTTLATQVVSASSDHTTLTWTRTGSGPELSAARFEISTDTITWTALGAATRVSTTSNWTLSGLSLVGDSTFYIRALGTAPTSKNASASVIRTEQVFNFTQTPVLPSGSVVAAATGKSFRYATSDGKTAVYSALGLPAGLSIDSSTGVITGTPTETGSFAVTVTASNAGGNVSATLTVSVGGTGGSASSQSIRLINLSARTPILAGATAITGFSSSGGKILVRAIGPGLSAFGVTGVLADPVLRIYNSAGVKVNENDNWSGSDVVAANVATGAFPLVVGSKDAALVLDLPAGGYTAQVTDSSGSAGVVLTEIYDANSTSATPRFSNLSTRAPVTPGNPLVGGFVITAATGTATQKVLIRGVGPGIVKFGVPNALADPVLKVYDAAGNLIATSDNWSSSDGTAAAATATGAFALDPGSKDAALLLTLTPGGYTFEVTAAPGTASGDALADIYAAP